MTKNAFWISYDLGLKGDYSGIYAWLDSVGAKECGDSMAFFSLDNFNGKLDSIKNEISKSVALNKTDRIYLKYLDSKSKKMKGVFLFGGRKSAPWEGYATENLATVEDSI